MDEEKKTETRVETVLDPNCSKLFGKNEEYYLPILDSLIKEEKMFSWNWASFFFGPIWMMYRKMYSFGLTYIFLAVLCSNVFFQISPLLAVVLLFAAMVIVGMLGNFLYFLYTTEVLRRIYRSKAKERPEKLENRTGVSIFMAFLTVILDTVSWITVLGPHIFPNIF